MFPLPTTALTNMPSYYENFVLQDIKYLSTSILWGNEPTVLFYTFFYFSVPTILLPQNSQVSCVDFMTTYGEHRESPPPPPTVPLLMMRRRWWSNVCSISDRMVNGKWIHTWKLERRNCQFSRQHSHCNINIIPLPHTYTEQTLHNTVITITLREMYEKSYNIIVSSALCEKFSDPSRFNLSEKLRKVGQATKMYE